MFKSIQTRFIAVYTSCTVLFMVILVLVVYIQDRQRLFHLEIRNSLEISKLHARIVGDAIQKNIAVLQGIAYQDAVKDKNISRIIRELSYLKRKGGALFVNTLFFGTNGTAVNYEGRTTVVGDRAYFKRLLDPKNTFTLSEPIRGRMTNRPLVVAAVPVISDDGIVQGGIGIALDLEVLSKEIEKVQLCGNSYGWIVNRNGTIIAHPNSTVPLNYNISQSAEKGYPGFEIIAEVLKTKDEGYGEYYDKSLGKKKIVTFSKIPSTPGWTLFITTLAEDVFQEVNEVVKNSVFAAGIVSILFILAVIQLTKTVIRPINQLTRAVRRSSRGDYAPLELKITDDEIGRLVRAYNEMTATIAEHTHELESLVADRTMKIEAANEQLSAQNAELERLNEQLHSFAAKDTLTGLFNRHAMESLIEKEMNRTKRFGASVSLIVLDIDHFKSINAACGHDAGDRILRNLARRLVAESRKVDSTARWGGEKFLVLASETGTRNAVAYAEKIRKNVMTADHGEVDTVTISAGVATYHPGESFEQWYARADKALRRAKKDGRNRVVADESDYFGD